MYRLLLVTLLLGLGFADGVAAQTTVPGHRKSRFDQDGNGIPDVGVSVNGHYTSRYAYDMLGNWFWDLGDGRTQGNVPSFAHLEQETLTICDYVINYRGKFENDPFLNSGWIQNHIRCYGYDGKATYQYLIVHKTDPRYRGIPALAIWGDWEYHGLITSGQGNAARFYRPYKY